MQENENLIIEDILLYENQENIETIETVEIIEVSDVETYEIDSSEAFPSLGEGNEKLQHSLLNGRELSDQHPITAITGLREELNDIEALGVVYSDKRNQADYYLWEDENILQENRIGYFVSAGADINEIKICTSESDIFGVTVEGAGFIGAQDDIARDIKYGLVITTGIVHVRCESSVAVGDYVVSNDYGCAQKNKNGYKVVGRHQIDGVEYAEITLVSPINQICELSDGVESVNRRMGDAETNIIAAINMANAAYNKAGEATSVSEEVLKDALDALTKTEISEGKVNEFLDETLPNINESVQQAKAAAESAATSALTAKNDAVDAANDALTKAGEIEKTVEPINRWEYTDPVTGETNTGATYFDEYVKNGLSTKADMEIVSKLDTENKLLIEKNAESYMQMLSSVDKYSVGEYSQAYGLTYEQAKSILKEGMIYIPVDNLDGQTHIEEYEGQGQENEFTEHNYYKWTGEDWEEHSNSVAFFSEELTPSSALTYWYIDSNEAPDGYEAHALYINQDGKWTKVNILAGNVNNRMTSVIRHTTDEVAIEITNARGSLAALGARLTDVESTVQTNAQWAKGKIEDGEELYNIATIKQTADDNGSSLALVVADTEGNKVLKGASIVLGQNEEDSYIHIDADNIDLSGVVTINDYIKMDTDGKLWANEAEISGTITANLGHIAGWDIDENTITKTVKMIGLSMIPEDKQNEYTEVEWIESDGESAYIDLGFAPTDTTGFEITFITYDEICGDADNKYGAILGARQGSRNQELQLTTYNSESNYQGTLRYGTNDGTGDQAKYDAGLTVGEKITCILKKDVQTRYMNPNQEFITLDNDEFTAPCNLTIFALNDNDTIHQFGKVRLYSLKIYERYDLIRDFVPCCNSVGTIGLYDLKNNVFYSGTGTFTKGNDVSKAQTFITILDSNTGSISSNNIEASGGKIGAWTLTDRYLYGFQGDNPEDIASTRSFGIQNPSQGSNAIAIGFSKLSDWDDAGFRVTHTGKLYAKDAEIEGTINATGGTFTDCTISDSCTINGTLNAKNIAAGTNNNAITFTNLTVKGTISAGTIISNGVKMGNDNNHGNWTFDNYTMYITGLWEDGKGRTIYTGFTPNRLECGTSSSNPGSAHWNDIMYAGNQYTGQSDVRVKKDIETLSDNYDTFFDLLQAKRYKYIDGTSDRYHTGYVAQEVVEALETANLDTKQFAGVVLMQPDTYEECWHLRRDEFVALNTWQIQKAKARITELEERVTQLEALINKE